MGQENYLRTGQVASLLSVNARTVRRWVALRHIRFITTPGGEHRIPMAEIARLLARPPDAAGDE
jgi:excisionase family DNA binding protein